MLLPPHTGDAACLLPSLAARWLTWAPVGRQQGRLSGCERPYEGKSPGRVWGRQRLRTPPPPPRTDAPRAVPAEVGTVFSVKSQAYVTSTGADVGTVNSSSKDEETNWVKH